MLYLCVEVFYYNQIRKPITIKAGGDHTRLPVAHTCVNTLDLPELWIIVGNQISRFTS